MDYKMSQKLLETILNYLAKQPFTEVAALINDIQQSVLPVEDDAKKQVIKESSRGK